MNPKRRDTTAGAILSVEGDGPGSHEPMNFIETERQLTSKLDRPLPGRDGQALMSPIPRFGWKPGEFPADCRQGGVLLLVYPDQGDAHTVLTVRDSRLPHHPGQVSLPGGKVEPGESIEEAALRESHEEVGLDPGTVRILGGLTPLHVPVSRFVLHPRVGVVDHRPELRPDLREVSRILRVPLERLLDPATLGIERRVYSGRDVEIPYFGVDGEKVWGATAMVLSEFCCLLGVRPDPKNGND